MVVEIQGGQRALNSTDDKLDVSDRAARALGKAGVQVAGADVANANALPVRIVDANGNPVDAAHPTFTDVIDRAARALGRAINQNAGGDIAPANGLDVQPATGTLWDIKDRAGRVVGKVDLRVAGADVSAGNPVNTVAAVAKTSNVVAIPSAARTVTGQSADIDVSTFTRMTAFLDISAATGTSPTLVVEIDVKDPLSGNYTPLYTAASQNGVVSVRMPLGQTTTAGPSTITGIGSTIRVKWTIGGVSPSFTFSVSLLFE